MGRHTCSILVSEIPSFPSIVLGAYTANPWNLSEPLHGWAAPTQRPEILRKLKLAHFGFSTCALPSVHTLTKDAGGAAKTDPPGQDFG